MNRTLLKAASAGAAAAVAWWGIRRQLGLRREIRFAGKTVLITGGSRGLGLVLARELAARGANLALWARDGEELERAAGELRSLGSQVRIAKCDMTRPSEVGEQVHRLRKEVGPVDVLINNAGVIQVGPLASMTVEDFDQAMATHFWGPFYAIQSVLPDMKRRQSGRIVNIASIGGQVAIPHMAPYCASKFALVGLSRALRNELVREGIYVTTVCPGLMRTGSARNALFKGKHREEYGWFSISSSLPVVAMSADRAGRQIVDACQRGEAELILSAPAQILTRFAHLFPNAMAELSSRINELLPVFGGIGTNQTPGFASQSEWSESLLTLLGRRAALNNNEIPPGSES